MTKLASIVFALNLFACAADPQTGVTCGDGICDQGETKNSCPEDCRPETQDGGIPCGDHICQSSETSTTCPQDCPPPPCGNGICAADETGSSCPADCAATFVADNRSSLVVYYLYAWRCGTSDHGTDLLGATTLQPNYMVTFDNVTAGCWNFEADNLNHTIIDSFANATITPHLTYTWNIF